MKRFFLCLVVFSMTLVGADFPQAPASGYYVADDEGIIDSKYESYINTLCREVNLATSVNMSVVTVSSVSNEGINIYADRLAEKWYPDQAVRDKTLVIVIAEDDHEVITSVGAELEKVLTSSKVDRTRRNIIIPNFKNHEYGRGVYWAMRTYAKEIEKEYDVDFETLEDSPGYEGDEFDEDFDEGCWSCWRAFTCLGWVLWWDSHWDHWHYKPQPPHRPHRPHKPHHPW
ncbi:TPM domain-containing protein [candidate division WOR-3 bacterium]|nr:TPM domain-containing protein [candidate division WOR-3 bacterium]